MPERQPDDGPLGVSRVDDDPGYLRFTHGDQWMVLSEYNAARLFGMLALFLKIPIPRALGKAIKLTKPGDDELNASFGFPKARTLGDKLAQHLVGEALQKRVSRCNAPSPTKGQLGCARIKGHEKDDDERGHSLLGEFTPGVSNGDHLFCVHGEHPNACQEPECRGPNNGRVIRESVDGRSRLRAVCPAHGYDSAMEVN